MPLPPTLSHYRLSRKIGEGGMGVVYEAWDATLKRKVALKVLPEALAADPVRLERFQREAETVAALSHPGIVTIHSIEEFEGIRFLTMELVEGEGLDRVVAAGALPVSRVLDIGIALTDALSAAHERRVVHRDLKPANVMLEKDGRLKVLDFGLAKLADVAGESGSRAPTHQVPLTLEGGVVGTAPYMSPEQVRAEPLDHRTDIFSLGVVLYELATGRRPFGGKNAAEVVSSILRDAPAPVTLLREELPPQLGRVIDRCLRKDLRERFQSVRDIHNELREMRDELNSEARVDQGVPWPGQVRPPGYPKTGGPAPVASARRGRRMLWTAVAVAALILAAGALVRFGLGAGGTVPGGGTEDRPESAPEPPPAKVASIAVLPFVNLSGDPDNEYFSDGLAEELLNSLAKNPSLHVAARTSSFYFKGKNAEIAEIGRRLNVDTIVEGSVRKQGDDVRITVQLVNAADGYHIWSETYDRRIENIFAMQEEITRSVTSSLQATLGAGGLAAKGTNNIEAYNLVLKGRYFWNRWGPGDLEKARDLFQQAVARDPGYARAWLGLAGIYGNLVEMNRLGRERGLELEREAALRALALDDSLAFGHFLLGWMKMTSEWDWAGAEAELERAMALEPDNPAVLNLAATLSAVQGRLREANEINHRILEIDPLGALFHNNAAVALYQEDRFDEALAAARKLQELSPRREGGHALLGGIYLAQGKLDVALQEYLQEESEVFRLFGLVEVYLALGRKDESDAALASFLDKYREQSPFLIACLHAFRGEPDEAFEWLDRAYDDRDFFLAWVKVEPDLRSLKGDPRWLPFLRKMRLAA